MIEALPYHLFYAGGRQRAKAQEGAGDAFSKRERKMTIEKMNGALPE